MSEPFAAKEIELAPLPGKTYFACAREWREEFIYFLMVDRFHDGADRPKRRQAERTKGFDVGGVRYGGTLAGVRKNLDYIAGLGCTAIWISPPFENNEHSYHGYDINNYLRIDPRVGTKQDLIDLVEAAHTFRRNGQSYPIRIVLDVVINHSGDNWSYPGGYNYYYSANQQFDFGSWRRNDRPIPTELRDPRYYHRRGAIVYGWDTYPETQFGDPYGLKDFANDDDPIGAELLDVLIKAHCYWIREADVDGFRVDAIKHMGDVACARFCSSVREYAYTLGKRGFFLFGELATPDDDVINRYVGPNTSTLDGGRTVFFGLDSILDFRLAEGNFGNPGLRDVLKGFAEPRTLFDRLQAQRERALSRGEMGRYLVTFLDNHDAFWQPGGRFGARAPEDQIIGGVGYLLCTLGMPCIYYGTEQGFEGSGGDESIREAMYDRAPGGESLHNPDCRIYREIAKIAEVSQMEVFRFGRMYYREISGDGEHFGLPYGTTYTLAFSRLLYGKEALVAYNVSGQPRNDAVVVDGSLHGPGDRMRFVYRSGGDPGTVEVEQALDGTRYVRLHLGSREFAILE
jgi:alpha-amylase